MSANSTSAAAGKEPDSRPEYRRWYDQVRRADGDPVAMLKEAARDPSNQTRPRRIAEMILVHHYDHWLFGNPDAHIAHAVQAFCAEIAGDPRGPPQSIVFAATTLAEAYAALDQEPACAHLLLEHLTWRVACDQNGAQDSQPRWDHLRDVLGRWRAARQTPCNIERLSDSDQAAWHEVERWEARTYASNDLMSRMATSVSQKISSVLPPRANDALAQALERALGAAYDSTDTVRFDGKLLLDAKQRGHAVTRLADLRSLPLAVSDELSLRPYREAMALAACEGFGTGLGGILLALVDMPAVLTLNVGYIRRIGAAYGYGSSSAAERDFVLRVLGGPTDLGAGVAADTASLCMGRVALGTASSKSICRPHSVSASLLRSTAFSIGIRMSRRKAAQLIPVAGAIAGGLDNALFTRENMLAARMLYRRRRLIEACADLNRGP